MTFPPLNTVDDTPIPTPGYKGDYIKYTFDGIITIVKEVKEANLPSDLQAVSINSNDTQVGFS